ncbi:ABC transporter permease [Nocardioides okcheonensis]|uniref:ABC transporter permease n=1 Tax=Nocardioides okcheonensis TaxID=2894081 RepID=UPI001E51083B|nr:ABC transporter permease [Nocardioides okcheonensis]UFN44636.1 ABC transporter permease [Nocardioides okcheonensis]
MPVDLVFFAAGLLALVLTTMAVARVAGVGLGWAPLVSLVRASAQLGVVALLLRGILTVPWTVLAFLALMLLTASWTAAGRLSELWHGRRAAVAGVLAGASVSLAMVLALRLVEPEPRYLVAVAGIVIGNAMSAATLSGRNFLRALRHRRDEVEAWLSLGATPSRAHLEIGRESVRESLLPNLDQTRSTGLVTLPGAFVGALFGGASPAVAAQFQLVVLAGIALAMVVTGVVVTRLLGRSPYVVPADEA